MKIAIISIGDELLQDRLNTNLIEICKILLEKNQNVKSAVIVKDKKSEIKKALAGNLKDSDIVFITGGLGPTIDDLTREAVAETLNMKLVYSPKIMNDISVFLKTRYKHLKISKKLQQDLKRMAFIFENSIVLDNDFGTAPGMIISKKIGLKNKKIVLLPGPPYEMKNMLINQALPKLKLAAIKNDSINKIYFKTFGISESELQIKLFEFIDKFCKKENIVKDQDFRIELGILPYFFVVTLKLTLHAKKTIFEKFKNEVLHFFDNEILTTQNITEQELLVSSLIHKNLKIAVAESCTGGLISKLITDISGSSKCFFCGYVVYSNELKMRELGVKKQTLDKFGAVSKETAEEMANGLIAKTNVDFAVSATGIAGPDGGTKDKPVGLVYIGIAQKNKKTEVFEMRMTADRETIRQRTAVFVMGEVIKRVKRMK